MIPRTRYLAKLNFPSNFKEWRKPYKRDSFVKENKEGPRKNNSRGRNCASLGSSLEFLDIGVLRGRHTILKASLKTMKRSWRKKKKLHPKKRCMIQEKKSIPLLRNKKKFDTLRLGLDFTPLDSRVLYKARRLHF